jgi:hypothetical protein
LKVELTVCKQTSSIVAIFTGVPRTFCSPKDELLGFGFRVLPRQANLDGATRM